MMKKWFLCCLIGLGMTLSLAGVPDHVMTIEEMPTVPSIAAEQGIPSYPPNVTSETKPPVGGGVDEKIDDPTKDKTTPLPNPICPKVMIWALAIALASLLLSIVIYLQLLVYIKCKERDYCDQINEYRKKILEMQKNCIERSSIEEILKSTFGNFWQNGLEK